MDTCRSATHDFLLTFYDNYRPISYYLWDKWRLQIEIEMHDEIFHFEIFKIVILGYRCWFIVCSSMRRLSSVTCSRELSFPGAKVLSALSLPGAKIPRSEKSWYLSHNQVIKTTCRWLHYHSLWPNARTIKFTEIGDFSVTTAYTVPIYPFA